MAMWMIKIFVLETFDRLSATHVYSEVRLWWTIFVNDVHLVVLCPHLEAVEAFIDATRDLDFAVNTELACRLSPSKGGITASRIDDAHCWASGRYTCAPGFLR